METIFRKVMCSDRLPEKEGTYDTSKGSMYYIPKVDVWNPILVKFWYEPIKLPSEEEVNELANDFEITCAGSTYFGYRAGFNKAIEVIKGETK